MVGVMSVDLADSALYREIDNCEASRLLLPGEKIQLRGVFVCCVPVRCG